MADPTRLDLTSNLDLLTIDRIEALADLVGQLQMEMERQPTVTNAQIWDLDSEKYRLREPILIVLEESPDEVIARFPEVEAVGVDSTEPEAILALKRDIVALYKDLTSSKSEELGRLPRMWLRILKRLIVEWNEE